MGLCETCGKPVRPTKVKNNHVCDYCERHPPKTRAGGT